MLSTSTLTWSLARSIVGSSWNVSFLIASTTLIVWLTWLNSPMHVSGRKSLPSTTFIDEETLALTVKIGSLKLLRRTCVFNGCIGDYTIYYKASKQKLLKNWLLEHTWNLALRQLKVQYYLCKSPREISPKVIDSKRTL